MRRHSVVPRHDTDPARRRPRRPYADAASRAGAHRRLAPAAHPGGGGGAGGVRGGSDRDLAGLDGRGAPGRPRHRPARRPARALRGGRRGPRHDRAHGLGRGRRPGRGPAAGRPARRGAAPAAGGAHRAGRRRGPRPRRRRHPRGRHAAAPGRVDGDPHRAGLRPALDRRRADLVAGLPAVPARRCRRPGRGAPAASADLGPQGRGGGGLDRPRRGAGGGHRRSRRPARQPRPGPRRTPLHRAGRARARPVRGRGRPGGPGQPSYRHASCTVPSRPPRWSGSRSSSTTASRPPSW